jgi:hypothetical protein
MIGYFTVVYGRWGGRCEGTQRGADGEDERKKMLGQRKIPSALQTHKGKTKYSKP